jgi:hypothetical protein
MPMKSNVTARGVCRFICLPEASPAPEHTKTFPNEAEATVSNEIRLNLLRQLQENAELGL